MNDKQSTPTITLDDLAIMVNKGFKEQAKNLEDFKIEVREGFKEVHDIFKDKDEKSDDFREEVRSEFKQVHSELREVRNLVKRHGNEIDDHEKRLCTVETELQVA